MLTERSRLAYCLQPSSELAPSASALHCCCANERNALTKGRARHTLDCKSCVEFRLRALPCGAAQPSSAQWLLRSFAPALCQQASTTHRDPAHMGGSTHCASMRTREAGSRSELGPSHPMIFSCSRPQPPVPSAPMQMDLTPGGSAASTLDRLATWDW